MSVEYLGLSSINGPLVILEGVKDAAFDEIVEMTVNGNEKRLGRIIEIHNDKAVIQVFEGTSGMALRNTHTRLTGQAMMLGVSEDMLGRTFNGIGKPIDDLGAIEPEKFIDINGKPLNPVSREYPRNYIRTGISSIDGLTTLIRGQKLPIFSGNGLPHDELAAQLVRQASLGDDANSDEKFAIIFAAMGVKHDVADFFRRTFEESGVSNHVTTFINLANDPVVERLITPKVALTLAEYLAFEKGMNILVILTDMTSFAEAMREVSSSKGEIPSRKGFPGYLYSELATIYERAGIVHGSKGSVTQIPILSMPNDDITHPIPDLTGYITEGQIVLDRELHGKSIYPPVSILPSLSRLMKDGIGDGYTRADHQDVANQLFSCYAKVGDARALASVIGEDELSDIDKKYLVFGSEFENRFIGQGKDENRTILDTLTIAWNLLGLMPRSELDRIDTKVLDVYYKPMKLTENGDIVPDSSQGSEVNI
jgi:ATP synthase alpha/beta chain, C terminal domain